MRIKNSLFIITSLLLLSACGPEYRADETYYEYEIVDSYRGCQTGYFAFKSKKKYCRHLVLDEENNSCARSVRRKTFEKECKGDWLTLHPVRNEIPYFYEFSDENNSCTTGYQTFDTLDDFCWALKNEKKNKGCAPDKRKELRTEYCN